MSRQPITNFARGEFAPELYGRVDVPQYNAGAKRIRNFVVQRYGGVAFRPGFRVVKELTATKQHGLKPFQYSMEQAYVLVMGDERMWVAAAGGMVTEEDLKIVSATNAAQAVLEVPFHGMAVGDEVYFSGNTGMDEFNGRFATVVAVPDANHITVNINSTAFGALTGSTGIIRTGAPAAPPTPEPPPPPPTPAPEPPTTTTTNDTATYFEGAYGIGGTIRGGITGYYKPANTP